MRQLEFQKLPDKEQQAILDGIASLNDRVAVLEKGKEDVPQHVHNGLDSPKIRVRDLELIAFKQVTINPGSLADGVGETQSLVMAGASLGDFVLASAPYDLQDITVTAYVQAADTVEIRVQNESGSTIDLASGTWRILLIKKPL